MSLARGACTFAGNIDNRDRTGAMRQGIERTASYFRQVDEAFRRDHGIAYSFLQGDLERSATAPRLNEAMSRRMSPDQFVGEVGERFGLKKVNHADAIPHNRRVAALVEFAAENPAWSVGKDGAIYREAEAGIERLAPGRNVGGTKFGFAASLAQDGFLDARDGQVVDVGGEFEPVAGALDIGDAVERLEATYEAGYGGPRM